MNKKIYLIWIGGIWVSALARHYLAEWWEVYGSDIHNSELIESLKEEWCDIIIGMDSKRIDNSFELIVYSEAIPKSQEELKKAEEGRIKTLKYTDALAEIVNDYKLIAIAGTHGKSTTTSMISQIFKASNESFKTVVWTILKEFDGKNYYSRWEKNYFIIEACEYKEHFLAYKPTVAVITNIEYDHADYFKTQQSYIDAYEKFIDNIVPNGFCILDESDIHSKSLIWKRKDINYILVGQNSFTLQTGNDTQTIDFPEIVIHIPGDHILFDAKLAYIVWYMAGIPEHTVLEALESYSGVWRRMEQIWHTENKNILMSDYGHHPTEIETTLKALKIWYPEKELLVVFQPHQYSRTIELFEGFKNCFGSADHVIISNIYESRDSEEDKEKMSAQMLADSIEHENTIHGNGLSNTFELIKSFDECNPNSCIILLLWAGDVDTLRYKIKTER